MIGVSSWAYDQASIDKHYPSHDEEWFCWEHKVALRRKFTCAFTDSCCCSCVSRTALMINVITILSFLILFPIETFHSMIREVKDKIVVDSWSQDSRATKTIFRRNTGQSRLKTLGHHDNFHDHRLKKTQD